MSNMRNPEGYECYTKGIGKHELPCAKKFSLSLNDLNVLEITKRLKWRLGEQVSSS